MTMLIPLTQMNGVPVLVGVAGIKMIEAYEWTPKPVDPNVKTEVAKDSAPAPVTTQPMVPPVAPTVVPPVVCSKITFHDNKELIVKELVAGIMPMAG
jgi:hypothetical protein